MIVQDFTLIHTDVYSERVQYLRKRLMVYGIQLKMLSCFLQVQIPKSCKQKWRNLHLRFGESCRLCGIAAAALQTCY